MKYLSFVFIALIFICCSEESNSVGQNKLDDSDVVANSVDSVASIYELGRCSSLEINLLRYVLSEKRYYQCMDEKWSATIVEERMSSSNYVKEMSSSHLVETESSSDEQKKVSSSSFEKDVEKPISSSSNIASSSLETLSSSSEFNDSILVDSRDGQSYKIVRIADQVWMAENLNYKVDSSWCYRNEPDSCLVFGRLYQWAAAMNLKKDYLITLASGLISAKHQGICPKGWHIPDTTEWNSLLKYIDLNNGDEPTGASLLLPKYEGSNKFGFGGVLSGTRSAYKDYYTDNYGKFYYANREAIYWSATEDKTWPAQAFFYYMYSNNPMMSSEETKSNGFAVRCKKD